MIAGRAVSRRIVAAPSASRVGITLIELLVAMALFLVVLMALSALFVASLRTHRTAEEQSLRIQETESVVHLINYEVGLAGYTRTQEPSTFTDAAGSTISVRLGSGSVSDTIRIRFFEDPDFLASGDSGERWVEYRVDGTTLVRRDLGHSVVESLVGGVASMRIVAFIGRDREVVTTASVAASGPSVLPGEIAGVRVTVTFQDGTDWTFLVGLYNRQRVDVTAGVG
jgi:type II secretory pathway component PulJ